MQLDPKVFEERLKKAVEPEKLRPWCERVGVNYSTLNSAFQRGAVPNPDILAQIGLALGRSIDWLLGLTDVSERLLSYGNMLVPDAPHVLEVREHTHRYREEPEQDWSEFMQIPLYEVKGSAGYGNFIDTEKVKCHLAFRTDFVRNRLGIEHSDLYCVSVDGVSMEPVLRHGHPALIDARSTDVLKEGPYFLRLEGALLLKNLQRLPGGRLRIWSENQATSAYAPIEIPWPPQEGIDLQIFGRIRWSDVVFF